MATSTLFTATSPRLPNQILYIRSPVGEANCGADLAAKSSAGFSTKLGTERRVAVAACPSVPAFSAASSSLPKVLAARIAAPTTAPAGYVPLEVAVQRI